MAIVHTHTVYGEGGYDPEKPDGNKVEEWEVTLDADGNEIARVKVFPLEA